MRRIFLAALLLTLGFAASGAALAAQGDNADNPSIAGQFVPDESDAGEDAWQDFPALDDWDAAAATPEAEDATEEVSGEADADALQDFPALDDWDAAAATPETENATEEVSDNATESDQDEEDEPDAQDGADAIFAMNFDDDADFAALREDAIRKASEFYDMSDFPQSDRPKAAAPPQATAVAPAAPAASVEVDESNVSEAKLSASLLADLTRLRGLTQKIVEDAELYKDADEAERLEAGIGMYRNLGREASAVLEKYAASEDETLEHGKKILRDIIDQATTEEKRLQEKLALLQQLKGLQDQVATLQQQRGVSEPPQAAQTPEPSDPLERLRWQAERGDAAAQSDLGFRYWSGQGVPLDYAEAARWYRLSANQGHAVGQYNLGVIYQYGQGVATNYAEAARLYRLSAEQGVASAQANLGLLYEHGQGVPMNKTEAMRWYRLAAEQGNAAAQHNIGVMYANGQGVHQDFDQAEWWLQQAANQGLQNAVESLQKVRQRRRGGWR